MNDATSLDLNHYCWRERIAASGEVRLLIPWSDPSLYEYPADGIFATIDEALSYKEEMGADGEDWVLVHYTGKVVAHEGVENGSI